MADAAFTEAHATLAAAGGGSTFNALGGAFAEPSPPLSQPPPPPPDNRNQWTVTCRAVQLFCSIVVFACTAGSDAYLDGQTSAEFTVLASVSLGLYCSTVLFLELYAASYSITSLAEADAATLYVADRAMLFWFYTGTVCVSTVVSTCESPCHSVRAASAFSFIACAALLVSIWDREGLPTFLRPVGGAQALGYDKASEGAMAGAVPTEEEELPASVML